MREPMRVLINLRLVANKNAVHAKHELWENSP